MFKKILFVSILLFSSLSFGQETGQSAVSKFGPRRQIATIVYMGLGGAVLGLSTLSFYGRPQDKLSNIPIGFGVGVIIGTIYMTYQAATNPENFYRQSSLEYKPDWSELKKDQYLSATDLFVDRPQTQLGYSWDF